MTSDYEQRSSSEVADEAEDVRADLAQTLDRLRNNLRPENMVEEVVTNARIGASTLADGLFDMARQNPLPAVLIGAGCALFMGFGARKALKSGDVLEHEPADAMASLRPRPRDRASGGLPLRTGSRSARLSSGPDDVDSVGSPDDATITWQSRRGTGSGPRPLGEAADEISSGARGKMMSIGRSMARSRRRVASQLPGVLHEQPLILAALGVAVGAAIGAVLPTTGTEDEWMGGASSSLRHAAQDVARDEIDELRTVASRAADNYKQAASEHGLSAENLSGLVKDIGDHTKSAIHDVGGGLDSNKV